jgi:CRP/FNR family cyclic AMP-dependent transcriptional regulator
MRGGHPRGAPQGSERESQQMSPWEQQPPTEPDGSPTDLRIFRIFQHFDDEGIAEIAAFASEQLVSRGQVIYAEEEPGADFYVVLAGSTEEYCATPLGRQPVSRSRVGQLLGEASFVDRRPRPTTAVAAEDGALLRFESGSVRHLLETRNELAAALSRSFWHSLAAKIRQANQFMAEIFPLEYAGERSGHTAGEKVDLKPGAKVGLFQESGLSAAELRLLATTLHAQHFPGDTYIFREGDAGDSLYIVFAGGVQICRRVGGGSEPLAVHGRGEVFGEMALVDDQARSADARAEREGCTVLVLSQADLDAVLHMPARVASQFLHLVCNVLCHRLRSMISLLASWRVRTIPNPDARPRGGHER